MCLYRRACIYVYIYTYLYIQILVYSCVSMFMHLSNPMGELCFLLVSLFGPDAKVETSYSLVVGGQGCTLIRVYAYILLYSCMRQQELLVVVTEHHYRVGLQASGGLQVSECKLMKHFTFNLPGPQKCVGYTLGLAQTQ